MNFFSKNKKQIKRYRIKIIYYKTKIIKQFSKIDRIKNKK